LWRNWYLRCRDIAWSKRWVISGVAVSLLLFRPRVTSRQLRTHSRAFTPVLQEIRRDVTRKVRKILENHGSPGWHDNGVTRPFLSLRLFSLTTDVCRDCHDISQGDSNVTGGELAAADRELIRTFAYSPPGFGMGLISMIVVTNQFAFSANQAICSCEHYQANYA
jgi:hypothetical protein